MIVDGKQFSQVYHAIKQDKYTSEDRAILIFVANIDTDSLCAAQQLQDIFHKDDMHYVQFPVEGYDEVRELCIREGLEEVDELRTVVMINCGATDDVRAICGLHDNVRLVILDSHRPIWHGYTKPDDVTIVLLDDDDPVKRGEIPEFEEGDDALRNPESEDESSEDDESEDPGSPSCSQSPGGGYPAEDGAEAERSKKRRKIDRDAKRLARQRLVDDYYSLKCGYGKPAALLLLNLAHSLQYDNQFHIWLAILGFTDQFLSQHMDKGDFEKWRAELEGHVASANGSILLDADADARDGLTNNKHRDRMVVAALDDLRLTLYRHWTVHDSMMYTAYTAARLQTWRDKGRNNLKLLLAKMSFPPAMSEIEYTSMKPIFQESLQNQLDKNAAQHAGLNMQQLRFQSFELQYKNELRLSASDMVHALSAVLSKERSEMVTAHDIFHGATDILFCHRHMKELHEAMKKAKHMAKMIVEVGGLAIQRNQVRGSRNSTFWYFNMADLDIAERTQLHHPIALRRLAVFLRDAMAQRSTFTKAIVLVGPPDAEGQCYAVSLRNKQQAGVMQHNPFAIPFAEAIAAIGIESTSTFDNAMFKFDKQHAENFIEELKSVVNAHSRDAPNVADL